MLADDQVSDAHRHEDISRAVAFSAGGDGGSGLLEESKTRTGSASRADGAVMISTRTALIAYAIICPLIWGGMMLVHMLQTPGVGQ